MNWTEIKEKYSSAHNVLMEWMENNEEYCDMDIEYVGDHFKGALLNSVFWGDRDLYDFFDDNGINVYVKPLPNKQWSVYVDDFGHHLLTEYIYKPTRKEAEKAAFQCAFKILEEKL